MKNIRVNIGCGSTPTKGWENFDNSFSIFLSSFPLLVKILQKVKAINPMQVNYITFCRENNIKRANAIKKIPLPDNSVEVLYSSHMMEHLDRQEASLFLKEVMRILKPNGIIRIAVPDIDKCIDEYNRKKDADEFIKSTLMYSSNPRTLMQKIRLLMIGNRHHLWMYNKDSLAKFVGENGFKNIKILQAGQTSIPDPESLNLYEREEDSIYLEAVK